MRMIRAILKAGLAVSALALTPGAPAQAQRLLGGLGADVSALTRPVVNDLHDDVSGLHTGVNALTDDLGADLAGARQLAEAQTQRLSDLVQAHPQALELDHRGAPVIKGQVIAIAPTPEALAAAQAAGFTLGERASLDGLGLEVVTLNAPPGLTADRALKAMRKLDPHGAYDVDPVYLPSGETEPAGGQATAPSAPAATAAATRVGLIDTGVAASHPAIEGLIIDQRGFAPGGVRPAAHGTAVASLIAGRDGRFQGAAPGAKLYVADVYGQGPTGGSVLAIVQALAWMGREHVPVINMSLVGPDNAALEQAVRILSARGTLIVAPVGNDGPAAPAPYPASYPQVIAVTAVDGHGRLLIEDGRAKHLDFAAPGAGLVAAQPAGGFGPVRGTSFAAPIVSGDLALRLARQDPAEARRAVAELGHAAERRGDPQFGRGLVGAGLARSLADLSR